MNIVLVDARGPIGAKVLSAIRKRGHHVLVASSHIGVDAVSHTELAATFDGAEAVIDVCEAPSRQDFNSVELIARCCDNVLSAAADAHVRHFVALSEVGADRVPDSAYFRAHRAREERIGASIVPHTILRATQFFERTDRIGADASQGAAIRVAPACMQPVLAEEVAAALTDFAVSFPRNSTLEMAGPQRERLDDMVRRFLGATQSAREVVTDEYACYLGAKIRGQELMPDEETALIGVTRFDDWLTSLRRSMLSPHA